MPQRRSTERPHGRPRLPGGRVVTGPLPLPELAPPSNEPRRSSAAEPHHVPVKGLAGTAPPPSSTADPPPRGRGNSGGGAQALVITVFGQPAPQGSKRHLGNGVMVESSKKVKPWREAVKAAALNAVDEWSLNHPVYWHRLDCAIWLQVTFTFARPRGHFGTGRNAALLKPSAPAWPTGYPDSSKVVRATEDALTDAGIWRDDARVVHHDVWKTYPGGHPDALRMPGAVVRIWSVGS